MEAIAVFGGASAILSIEVEGERLHRLIKTSPIFKFVVFSRSCLMKTIGTRYLIEVY